MANRKNAGNTIAEYGMLLGICAILAMGSVAMLGHSMNGLFGQASSAADAMLSNNLGLGAGSKMLGGTTVAAPVVRYVGNPVNSPNTTGESDPSLLDGVSPASVNVSSVEGAHVVLGSTKALQKLAQSIQDDPSHDPTVLALITALAKNGHTAANSMTQAIAPNKSVHVVTNTANVSTAVVNQEQVNKTVDAATAFKSTSDKLTEYLQTHPDALSPEMTATVEDASKDTLGVIGSLVNFDAKDDNKFDKINQQGWINYANKASRVHHDADTICRNGGDTDSCEN